MRILIYSNSAWNIYNFRLGIVKKIVDSNYQVITMGPVDFSVRYLASVGATHIDMPMSRGFSPLRDLSLIWRLFSFFRNNNIDLLLAFTIKPNIYGSFIARIFGVKSINNITGLGSSLIGRPLYAYVGRLLYKYALMSSSLVFFQNIEDREYFINYGICSAIKTSVIPGSGLNFQRYLPKREDSFRIGHEMHFLFFGRLLKDKGIIEFLIASRYVQDKYPKVFFYILGDIDPQNHSSIRSSELDVWLKNRNIIYLHFVEDPRNILEKVDCVVLPSYREGVPRSLLESAAVALPVITTDVPGCRDVVDDGITGYLCAARDALDLSNAMEKMIELPLGRRLEMGRAGRKKVELQFDEKLVIAKYMQAIQFCFAEGSHDAGS